jgi:hypothetical protein
MSGKTLLREAKHVLASGDGHSKLKRLLYLFRFQTRVNAGAAVQVVSLQRISRQDATRLFDAQVLLLDRSLVSSSGKSAIPNYMSLEIQTERNY